MHFPVSGVEVNPFLPPAVALLLSTFTSTGGISGAFLLLPFQVSVLQFTSPAVSPTNLVYNIVAIPSGVYRYIREGRMNWPVTWVVVIGTLPGIAIGAWIRVNWMLDPHRFKLFIGLVLLYIGSRLLHEQTPWGRRGKERILEFEKKVKEKLHETTKSYTGKGIPPAAQVRTVHFGWRKVTYSFLGEEFTFSVPGLLLLAFLVGLVGGTYGIGGGAIIAPFLAAVFALPVYTIAGAALTGTFLTSIAGVVIYTVLAPWYRHAGPVAPDWALGALFGLGGLVGMYIGAGIQKRFSGRNIRLGLGIVIAGLALSYIVGFFLK